MADPYSNPYFLLKWSGGTKVRYFRLTLADAEHDSRKQLSGFSRNLDGQLVEITAALAPRIVDGIVRVGYTATGSFGTYAELLEAWAATDLEAQLWDDADYWAARWIGPWRMSNLDPLGNYRDVVIHLEQRS